MTYAKNVKEAEKEAWAKFYGDDLNHCLYHESNPKLTETDEWLPEIETTYTSDGLGWQFNPSQKTKEAIANFIKDSVDEAIK